MWSAAKSEALFVPALFALLLGAVSLTGCADRKERPDPAPPEAQAYLEDADQKIEEERYTEARALLEVASEEGVSEADIASVSARLERQMARQALADGDNAGAREHFERAADLEPDDEQTFDDLMAALEAGVAIGAPPEELAPLASRAVELRTRSEAAQRHAARLWDDAGDAERALPYYQWLHKVDPDDLQVALRLATLYRANRRLSQARKLFEHVLELDADHVVAALQLADILARLDEHERAAALYEDLVDSHPDRPGILMRYARFLDERGEFDRAEALRERARQASSGPEKRNMRKLR
jgi:Tfp pilus assembly protein PilF